MFKKDQDRTPPELATRARLNVIARLAGCGYLIYIITRILKETEDNKLFKILAIVIILAAAVVILMTVMEVIKGIKTGVYKEETYYTDEYLALLEREKQEYRLKHPEEFEDEENEECNAENSKEAETLGEIEEATVVEEAEKTTDEEPSYEDGNEE